MLISWQFIVDYTGCVCASMSINTGGPLLVLSGASKATDAVIHPIFISPLLAFVVAMATNYPLVSDGARIFFEGNSKILAPQVL